MSDQVPDDQELIELIGALRDERITPDQMSRLEQMLGRDAEARRLFVELMRLHGLLEQGIAPSQQIDEHASKTRPAPVAAIPSRSTRTDWRPFGVAALAAGLLIAVTAWIVSLPQQVDDHGWNGALHADWKVSPVEDASYAVIGPNAVRLLQGELLVESKATGPAAPLRIETPYGEVSTTDARFYVGTHQPTNTQTDSKGEPMKPLTRVFVLAGAAILANSLGSVTGEEQSLLVSWQERAPVKTVVKSNQDFAFELYRQLAKENQGENLFFSPYSMSSALAMATEGARGQTALEMGRVLAFAPEARRVGDDAQQIPWQTSLIHTGMGQLNQQLNKPNKAFQLKVANALWGEQTMPFRAEFVKALSDSYGVAAVVAADFIRQSEAERQRVNQWVEKQTEERIKDLLPEGSVDSNTRLVIANAIYFKGNWSLPFIKDRTMDREFARADGRKVKTPMMSHHKEKFRFVSFKGDGSVQPPLKMDEKLDPKGFALIEMPYEGDQLSMLAIAPNDPKGLAAIETQLTSTNLAAWQKKMTKQKVNVVFPKLKLETKYNMKATLADMGMPTAFEFGKADFSGINEQYGRQLAITGVFHKAFVEVNEKGTEAAAATGIAVGVLSAPMVQTPRFDADRPFIFLIQDRSTGTILFVGRVTEPKT